MSTEKVKHDGWTSLITGIGTSAYDKRIGGDFAADVYTDEQITEMWRGDDLGGRIVETYPQEMLREGFELQVQDDDGDSKDLQDAIAARWKDLNLNSTMFDALAYERAYGGSAVLMGAQDGQEDLSSPLVIKRVRALDWLTVLEPRELQPWKWYADPMSKQFGTPATYNLTPIVPGQAYEPGMTSAPQMIEVHESRLLLFSGTRVSKYQTTSSTGHAWFGDSIFTRVAPILRDFGVAWSGAAILLSDFAQAVFKVKGLAEIIATDNTELFKARMQAVELARSIARCVVIDADSEEFERKQTPISGLPEMLDRFATRVAAAAGMPVTMLFGQAPAGLNATGESDIRFFYDKIKAVQTQRLQPQLEKLTRILLHLETSGEPDKWSIQFNPLWQPSDAEQATSRKTQAETDQIYIVQGVLSPQEVTTSRFGGEAYSYETQLDEEDRTETSAIETDPAALGAGAAALTGPSAIENVSKTALNGAQVSSMIDVIAQMNAGMISRESAMEIIRVAFRVSTQEAAALLGPTSFVQRTAAVADPASTQDNADDAEQD